MRSFETKNRNKTQKTKETDETDGTTDGTRQMGTDGTGQMGQIYLTHSQNVINVTGNLSTAAFRTVSGN
jgi:hypothetical protein